MRDAHLKTFLPLYNNLYIETQSNISFKTYFFL